MCFDLKPHPRGLAIFHPVNCAQMIVQTTVAAYKVDSPVNMVRPRQVDLKKMRLYAGSG